MLVRHFVLLFDIISKIHSAVMDAIFTSQTAVKLIIYIAFENLNNHLDFKCINKVDAETISVFLHWVPL